MRSHAPTPPTQRVYVGDRVGVEGEVRKAREVAQWRDVGDRVDAEVRWCMAPDLAFR